ncbi:MAG: hypothetical protein P1U41_08940, partial [Vicingaceae bacterium]|nr:hypothetical protein [Vicingaceae bacterium]
MLCLFVLFSTTELINAQSVTGKHTVEPKDKINEYVIKTEISGLKGVDIARVIYSIKNTHTYKKSANNTFFANSKNNEVKFYIMAVPLSGVLNIEFNIVLSGKGEFLFPVRIEYSKNEEKKLVKLSHINIINETLIASQEHTNNKTLISKNEKAKQEQLLAEQKAKEEA